MVAMYYAYRELYNYRGGINPVGSIFLAIVVPFVHSYIVHEMDASRPEVG